jgi:hypothetical protein
MPLHQSLIVTNVMLILNGKHLPISVIPVMNFLNLEMNTVFIVDKKSYFFWIIL